MATFAERLKQLREERNLGQEELGAELGVSKNTVYRWEANRQQPKEEHVMFLSNYFKVGYLYLIGAVDDRNVLTDEEASTEKEDEELMLKLYRSLSPDMKKMIRLTVNSAYLVEHEKQVRKECRGQVG